ncbi:MAG: chemotaxis protein CheX, partial [Bdellovibrionia bacterium]
SRYTTLVFPKHCSSDISPDEHLDIAGLLTKTNNLLINGIRTADIDENWIAILQMLKYKLDSAQKKLRFVNFSRQIVEQLTDTAFKQKEIFSSGVAEALNDFKSDINPEINTNFIKAFIQITPIVLYAQTQMLCKQKKISMKKDNLSLLPGEISGIIKVSIRDVYYAIILCFPTDTFLKIMSRIKGENFTEINKDIQEGAAELISGIFEQVRTSVKKDKSNVTASIPAVFLGSKLTSLDFEGKGPVSMEKGKMVTVPFESHFGEFFIEAWFPSDFTGIFLG